MTAMMGESEDDPITWSDSCDGRAYGLDDSGALVAQDCRKRVADLSVGPGDVRVTDTGRSEPHQHLVGTQRRQLELHDLGLSALAFDNCRTSGKTHVDRPTPS
jgi:hypothetical protein